MTTFEAERHQKRDWVITCDRQVHLLVVGFFLCLDQALVDPRVVDPEAGDLVTLTREQNLLAQSSQNTMIWAIRSSWSRYLYLGPAVLQLVPERRHSAPVDRVLGCPLLKPFIQPVHLPGGGGGGPVPRHLQVGGRDGHTGLKPAAHHHVPPELRLVLVLLSLDHEQD